MSELLTIPPIAQSPVMHLENSALADTVQQLLNRVDLLESELRAQTRVTELLRQLMVAHIPGATGGLLEPIQLQQQPGSTRNLPIPEWIAQQGARDQVSSPLHLAPQIGASQPPPMASTSVLSQRGLGSTVPSPMALMSVPLQPGVGGTVRATGGGLADDLQVGEQDGDGSDMEISNSSVESDS
jgi:hypothetical protein